MAEVPTYPIVHQQGDSLIGISWQWKGVDGQPKDLTGYSASLKVFGEDDESPVLEFTDAVGEGLTLDGPNGKVTLAASPSIITGLSSETKYRYTIVVTSSDVSIVKTLTKGDFRVDGLPA